MKYTPRMSAQGRLSDFMYKNLKNGIYVCDLPAVIDYYCKKAKRDFEAGDPSPHIFFEADECIGNIARSFFFNKLDFGVTDD